MEYQNEFLQDNRYNEFHSKLERQQDMSNICRQYYYNMCQLGKKYMYQFWNPNDQVNHKKCIFRLKSRAYYQGIDILEEQSQSSSLKDKISIFLNYYQNISFLNILNILFHSRLVIFKGIAYKFLLLNHNVYSQDITNTIQNLSSNIEAMYR